MPIEQPHLGRWKEQRVVLVHVLTPRAEIQSAMHAALAEISAALEAQGVSPARPWFVHHHRRPTDTFDFDVCFPVATSLALSGRWENAELPEQEVVRTAYHGPYEGLPAAWQEFVAWIEAHGHKTREDAFEVYSRGPREDRDPEAWQTDLLYPLMEGQVIKEQLV